MALSRGERTAAIAVAGMLVVAALGAIITAPREYPVTAFLLAPLATALVADRRVTAVVAALATIAGAVVAIAGDHYEGGALWFRLAFLGLAGVAIVGLTATRETQRREQTDRETLLRRRTEQRYRSLAEATSSIVWSVDPEGRFTDAQPKWEEYTGQQWPAYAGHKWLAAVHPDDRDRFVRAWLANRAALSVGEVDFRLWNAATSSYRFVVARGVPILEGEILLEWIGTVTDVHDQTEAVLHAAEDAQLRNAVLQSLQDGVYVAAAGGAIIDVNDSWPRLFGYRRDEVLGEEPPYAWWPDPATHPDEYAACEGMGTVAAGDRDSDEFEVTFCRRDGQLFPALVTVTAVHSADGTLTMLVGTVKDMTVHAEAEARLRAVAQLTARLSSATDLAEIGAVALSELMAEVDCPHGAVFAVDEGLSRLSLVADTGLTAAVRNRWMRVPYDLAVPTVDVARTREPLLLVERAEFIARYPGLADYIRQLGFHTTVHVPLVSGDAVFGVLFLAFDRERPLCPAEMSLLQTVAPIIAQALDRARLFELQRSVATTLQRALLTDQPVAPDSIAVAARYVPAVAELAVGGDWYDVVTLDADRVAIAVGDIVGRGINAAAVMGQLRSALSAVARTTDSAVDAVARLDRFAHDVDGARATTLLYGIVDAAAGTLRYTSAGHPPALLVGADGRARFLDDGRGWPLAVAAPHRLRPEAIATIAPGDTIVLYTDGLVERRAERLDDGLARLAHAAERRAALPVEQMCDELLDELLPDGQADDVALVALRLAVAAAPSFTCRIPAVPRALSRVRYELRTWLVAQELPETLRDDMLLAVGEACSNAIEHAYRGASRDTVVVEGLRTDDELVFTVRDYGAWRPLVPNPSRNRGLRLINEVTDDVKIATAREGGTRIEMRKGVSVAQLLG
jgi:PAS domain S-box-containing protein